MSPLLKKLVVNALKELSDRYNSDGCNDLEKDDPLLKGVSGEEFTVIHAAWAKHLPQEAARMNYQLVFNTDLIDAIIEVVKEQKE